MKRDGEVFRVCYFRSGWEETLNVEVPQRLTAERANLFFWKLAAKTIGAAAKKAAAAAGGNGACI